MNKNFTKRTPGRSGVTIPELAFVICIFLVMVTILTPFVRMTRARAGRINCANNLRGISLGLHSYAADHGETFPPNLGALYPDYVKDEKVFDCPASKNIGTRTSPDYKYTPDLTESSQPTSVIVEDLDGNHKKSGKNVLRVNGSVDWVSGV